MAQQPLTQLNIKSEHSWAWKADSDTQQVLEHCPLNAPSLTYSGTEKNKEHHQSTSKNGKDYIHWALSKQLSKCLDHHQSH